MKAERQPTAPQETPNTPSAQPGAVGCSLQRLVRLLDSMPPAPWHVDTGTMADKMTGCWLIRSANRHDFPSWLLATSGHKDAREIAELVCHMRNMLEVWRREPNDKAERQP